MCVLMALNRQYGDRCEIDAKRKEVWSYNVYGARKTCQQAGTRNDKSQAQESRQNIKYALKLGKTKTK